MTQIQQADRRTGVLTSALVAAAVSATITVSGLLVASQIVVPTSHAVPAAAERVMTPARLEQLQNSERAWELQRQQQSADAIHRERLLQQYGADWEAYYAQTNPNR